MHALLTRHIYEHEMVPWWRGANRHLPTMTMPHATRRRRHRQPTKHSYFTAAKGTGLAHDIIHAAANLASKGNDDDPIPSNRF